MKLIEQAVITECLSQFPEAVNEIEAVDLMAQKVWKGISQNPGNMQPLKLELEKNTYVYLNTLRKELNDRRIIQLSGFIVNN